MDAILDIVTLLSAGGALIVSIVSLSFAKRTIYSNIIAAKRFDWMDAIRSRLSEFIDIFSNNTLSKNEKLLLLQAKKFQVELYMDNRVEEYAKVSKFLDRCIELVQSDKPLNIPPDLIPTIQKIFTNSHRRAKREAGITSTMDAKMTKSLLGREDPRPPQG